MPTTTPARNGVDTGALFSTIDLVKSQPELALQVMVDGACGRRRGWWWARDGTSWVSPATVAGERRPLGGVRPRPSPAASPRRGRGRPGCGPLGAGPLRARGPRRGRAWPATGRLPRT